MGHKGQAGREEEKEVDRAHSIPDLWALNARLSLV